MEIYERDEMAMAEVPQLFRDLKVPPDDAYEVFRLLDEQPGLFGGYGTWHSLLRRCRNDPEYRLFWAIRGER